MRLILSTLLIISAYLFLSVETKAQPQTPQSSITVRDWIGDNDDAIVCGGYISFTVNVANTATDKPTFNWTISWGEIISGQGTPTITVDSGPSFGYEITAAVEINGVAALTNQSDRRVSRTVRVTECMCPTIDVSCPIDTRRPGEPVTISVTIARVYRNMDPKYKWDVSAGKISSGQGTPAITVDTTDLAGQNVTATVEIDGLPPGCDKTRSCSLVLIERAPSARKVDEYGEVSSITEEARLGNFGIQLQHEPDSKAYVIIYGPRHVDQNLERVRKFLIEKRGVDPNRIVLTNGGNSKKTKVELWIAPVGAEPPKPNPNF